MEMTRALVVYESIFGNTELIARAVVDGLEGLDVTCVDVSNAPTTIAADVDLLVVGGPTHALGLTRPRTRSDAVRQGAKAGRDARFRLGGVREWLDALREVPRRTVVAAFDTKFKHAPGSASKAIARRLRRRGGQSVTPMSFFVVGTTGPLRDGELQRAREWGGELARRAVASRSGGSRVLFDARLE